MEASQNAGSGRGISRNFTATCLVPVICIKQLGHALPLAKALVEGGFDILGNNPSIGTALEAIRTISTQVPGARRWGSAGIIRYRSCPA